MSCPAFFAACSTAAHPPRTMRSASETFVAAGLRAVEVLLDRLEGLQHRGQFGRLVDLPVPLRRKADPRPVGPATHVGAAEGGRRRPRGGDQLRDGQSRSEDLGLEGGDVRLPDQVVIDGGDGVLPQLRLRNPRAEEARDGAHVAVQQLVPRLGERVGELVRVLVEALGDRRVDRIQPQRQVGRQHHRGVPLRRVVRIRHGVLGRGVPGSPLLRAGGARRELPLVAEQVVEVPVVPLHRVVGPGALEPAGDRVGAVAAAVGVLPAEALVLDGAPLGLGADELGVACTVALAERVAAGDERDRLLVVHRHPGEGLPDVAGGSERVRVAVGPLRVHVDQSHLHGTERTGELPVAGVALISEPRVLGSPEDLLGLPDVRSPEGEAERLEPHRLHGDSCRRRPGGRPRRSSGRTSA